MSRDTSSNAAGFSVRCAAIILDNVVAGLIFFVLVGVYVLIFIATDNLERTELMRSPLHAALHQLLGLNIFIIPICNAAYFIGFWHYFGATPGKMWCKLRIVDSQTGEHPRLFQFIIRFLGYILSAIPLYLGFLWVLIDPQKEAWHDKLARTKVVEIKKGA